MRIPNADRAVIEPSKLHGYLLSRSHPVGRFKAAFFSSLGYRSNNWRQLDSDLRTQHLHLEAVVRATSQYGRKYEVRGTLTGPNGKTAGLVSVWFVSPNDEIPRFVTAYPGDPK